MNVTMQRKNADFSKLPVLLKVTTDQLEHLKEENSECWKSVESEISLLKEKHDTALDGVARGSARSRWFSITTIAEYRTEVAIPYIDALLINKNMKSRFTDKAVKIIMAISVFNPSLLPTDDSITSYGNDQIQVLAEFYGEEAEVQYAGSTFTSPPLLDREELLSVWKYSDVLFCGRKKSIIEHRKELVSPSMQDILAEMEKSRTYI